MGAQSIALNKDTGQHYHLEQRTSNSQSAIDYSQGSEGIQQENTVTQQIVMWTLPKLHSVELA